MMTDDHILVVTDASSDARLLKQLLDDDFSNIATSTDAPRTVADFVASQPRILVLAFNSLQKAEDCYLGLHRQIPIASTCPHRTVVLCSKESVHRAYDLCKKGQFDDYVLFWPLSFDSPRLHMAIHGALRELHRTTADAHRSEQLLGLTRQVIQLEPRLRDYAARSNACVDEADESLHEIKASILSALKNFGEQLAVHSINGDSGSSEHEIRPVNMQLMNAADIETRFAAVSGAMQSLRQLSGSINEELTPQIQSARALNVIAESAMPGILVVDSDGFQHRILQSLLAELHADISFASSGAEAFAMLQQNRPDLILVESRLPDMNGGVVIRNVKSVELFATIPVIMIMEQLEKGTILEGKAAGAIDFIGKPFERDSLLAKVGHWLQVNSRSGVNS